MVIQVEPSLTGNIESRRELLAREITAVFVELSGVASSDIVADVPFVTIGFDSLFLTQAASALKRRFNVMVSFRQLLELTPTVESLAEHLDGELDSSVFQPQTQQLDAANESSSRQGVAVQASVVNPGVNTVPAEQQFIQGSGGQGPNAQMAMLIRQQIDLLTRQLASLGAIVAPHAPVQHGNTSTSSNPASMAKRHAGTAPATSSGIGKIGPWKPIAKEIYETDSDQSRLALKELVEAYNRKTPKSKSFASNNRSHFADPRSSFSFSRQWKESVYPLVSSRSDGSRMWDIDGNEYLDIQSGFGSVLFGHNDTLVRDAIVRQLDDGMQIGPQSALAGKVAEGICDHVEMDRATFCNTGSEAVLAAMRIARTATGKDLIVMFAGDYHGIFDEVVVRRAGDMMALKSMPVAPGIPVEAVENIVVLDFGDPASLDVLDTIADEVAGVLIEPVQSRRPDHQPVEFLKKLRQWSTDNDVVYIFDEVITGFRVHPRGAQGLYDIKADLCAYGKIIGGGMPMGVLTGRRDLMDTLDGGAWDYGDDSVPEVGITYFAGTFVRHPLTIAAADATLGRIVSEGDQIYPAVHAMSHRFVTTLNERLQVLGSPIHIQNCCSMMCVEFRVDSVFNPLFFIHLRLQGVYMLESGTFFMTTAHTDEDIERLLITFEAAANWMLENGFHPSMHKQLDALSVAQQEIWLASQLSEEANLAYNTSMTLDLRGYVDLASLKQAMIGVVNLHDSLRLTLSDSGQPGIGAPVLNLPVSEHDLRTMDVQEQKRILLAEADRDMSTPFNLEQSPLIRFSLFRLSDEHCKLYITLHHIAGDGWSFGIVARDLGMLYQGKAIDEDNILQMSDYVSWLREDEQQERNHGDVGFWAGIHEAPLPPLDLPLDGVRSAKRTFAAKSASLDAPDGLVQQIEQVSRAAGVTSYHFLLTVCQLLVQKLSGESQFNVAIPVAGQQHAENPNLVCHCVSLSCLRCELSASESIESLIKNTRSLVFDAFEHSFCNVTEIADALELPRDTSRNPLFSVMFNVDVVDDGINFGELDVEIGKNASLYEFSEFFLDIAIDGDRMQLNCSFNSDLYAAESVQRWLQMYVLLADSMLSDLKAPLSSLNALPASDLSTIAELNSTQSAYEKAETMVSLFSRQAAEEPGRVALQCSDGQWYDYATLDAWSNQLATYLLDSGELNELGRIGVYFERDVLMVVALLAVMKSGAAYVPLDPLFPVERLSLMAEDAQLSVVLTQQQLSDSVPGSSVKAVVLDAEDAQWRQASDAPVCLAQPSKTAYVIYTSGSTGRPKGVSVGHRSLVNFLCSMQQRPGLSADDRLLAVTTLSFDIAALELYLPLISGAQIVLSSREESIDPMRLAERLETSGATVMQATPATWRMLVDSGWPRLPDGAKGLKILCGGESLARDLADALLDRSDELWNLYGPTETTIWSTLSQVERGEGVVGVGLPIANTQVYVLDEQMRMQPLGISGELYIGGDGVAEGYVDRAELTASVFVPDVFASDSDARLYRTGDRARWRRDGTLEVLGRLDEQVKLRGYRIEPGEIRARLMDDKRLGEAVVVVREDEPGDARLVGYLVAASGIDESARPTTTELRERLQESLPEYMVPVHWCWLDKFPLTPNGKVDRKALPVPAPAEAASATEYEAPQGDTEQALASIWSGVLNVQSVSRSNRFFAMGGHSLKAVQVVSRVRDEMTLELPLKTVFEDMTLAELATFLDGESHQAVSQTQAMETVSRDDPQPLSFAQERLWFLDELEGPSALYNIAFALHIKGELNTAALQNALQDIVDRHDVLRSSITTRANNRPSQLAGKIQLTLEQNTISGTQAHCQSTLQKQLAELAAWEFDLADELKIRASLLRLEVTEGYTEHTLVVVMHHIAADGWSLNVFSNELEALYAAHSRQQASPLSAMAYQFADYAVMQRASLDEHGMNARLDYWRQQLAGIPAVLDLPLDYPRPAVQGLAGDTVPFSLSRELSDKIRQLSEKSGSTLYTSLLGSFAVLLSRYTAQEDIVIGSPTANRSRVDVESMIGLFVNTLVLRVPVQRDATYLTLLENVSLVSIDAFQHDDVPFERLVEELQPDRSMSYSPLFQVMFVLQPQDLKAPDLAGLDVSIVEIDDPTAKFDLTLDMRDSGERLQGSFNFRTELFRRDTIERMVDHFETLLERLVESPEVPVKQISLLGEHEKSELLDINHHSQSAYEKAETMVSLFSRQVAEEPGRVALQCSDGQWYDYATLDAWSNQLATYLLDSGELNELGRIGVYFERDVLMVVALLAVMKSGAAYVPLDPLFPVERLSLMAEDAQLSVVLTQQQLSDSVPGSSVKAVVLDAEDAQWRQASDAPVCLAQPSKTAYVIYTSGSTGRPKGVSVGHRSLVNFLCSMQQRPGLSADDRLLAVTTLSFDIAALELYLPLISGAQIVLSSREESIDPMRLAERLETSGATVMQATPATWRMLVDSGWPRLPDGAKGLKILCGGESLARDLADALLDRSDELWNLYGPTETTIWSTLSQVERGEGVVGVGLPIANTQVYVLDEQMRMQPLGISGELYIGGDGVAEGYVDRAELTASVFVPDVFASDSDARLYRTGDRARWRRDGTLEVLGRLDEQVKLRGYRIEPGEIRARLMDDKRLGEAVVVVREDEPGDARLVGYLVAASGIDESARPTTTELRERLQESLPEYMVPVHWCWLDKFPLTPNGKVDRKALPVPAPAEAASATEYEAPDNEQERIIASVWADVLAVDKVGRGDDFFLLGGHSLKAVQALARLRKELGMEVPLRLLFEQSTVAALARQVEGLQEEIRLKQPTDIGEGRSRLVL